jgi:hypothetical protein
MNIGYYYSQSTFFMKIHVQNIGHNYKGSLHFLKMMN